MGVRKELLKKVKRHIRDLKKRGIDVENVTGGKTLEKLAWSKTTYAKFMERKKSTLKEVRENEKYTNAEGYRFTKKQYQELKNLENKFNRKKENEMNKMVKQLGRELTSVEKAFFLGKTVRHANSSENIQLQENFGKENLIDRVTKFTKFDKFMEITKEKINNFSFDDVLSDQSDRFYNDYLKGIIVDDIGISEEERRFRLNSRVQITKQNAEELLEYYKNMDLIQKVQFNKDMNRKMTYVESSGNNIYTRMTTYELIRDLLVIQDERKFIVSG